MNLREIKKMKRPTNVTELWDIDGIITADDDPITEFKAYLEVYPNSCGNDNPENCEEEDCDCKDSLTIRDFENHIWNLQDEQETLIEEGE